MTHALSTPEETTLFRLAAARAPRQGKEVSGFRLVTEGPDAFVLSVALANAAEKTLDLQYYAWRADGAGRYVFSRVMAAARRGVRVRILLDDLEAFADDADLAALSRHPNLEFRLYNPFPWRQLRRLNLILDLQRLNHRMHNKTLIADNAVALIGGRNIGDQYATVASGRPNYRDLDLLAVGPVARQLSASFDAFWNSGWSIRPETLMGLSGPPPPDAPVLTAMAPDHPFASSARQATARLGAILADLTWAPAVVLADAPDKPETGRSRVLESLHGAVGNAVDKELLFESAYLIPAQGELAALCRLAASGVRVRILTNSLASTDSVAAGAAYLPYRAPLLACGVELFEQRRRPAFAEHWGWAPAKSGVSLHSKVGVFDGRYVFVGSLNLDPRSRAINTEQALVIDSPELARQARRFIEDGMALQNAYRLGLNPDGTVVWEGSPVSEPEASLSRRISALLLSILPHHQL